MCALLSLPLIVIKPTCKSFDCIILDTGFDFLNNHKNLFKDLSEQKAVLTKCLAGSSLAAKFKDVLSHCKITNVAGKATCYTFEEIMTDVKKIQESKKCFQKKLGFGPHSKLSTADRSQLPPAVIAALSSTAPNPQCTLNALGSLTNAYKPCARLDQQQLAVIRRYGMEFASIDCGFIAFYEACKNVTKF